MTDQNGHDWPYKRKGPRLGRGSKIDLEALPGPEELDSAHDRHQGDDADRLSLYTRDQQEAETRDVKLMITFGDVIKVRDQAEMIIEAMRAVIAITRQHDLGSVRQRIQARSEAASCGRALSRFNGKTPYGEWKPKKRRS